MTTRTKTRAPSAAAVARRERQLAEARAALAAAGATTDEVVRLAGRVVHVASTLALLPTAHLHGDPMIRAACDVLVLHRGQAAGDDRDQPPRRPRRATRG